MNPVFLLTPSSLLSSTNLPSLFFLHFVVPEFDAFTGSKISSIDIGASVVRMSYSPTSGHAVIAILEVGLL